MYVGIKHVQPRDDYVLLVIFENGERRVFDVKPYLEIGRLKALKDPAVFKTVRVEFDTIEWPDEIDIDPEAVYQASRPA